MQEIIFVLPGDPIAWNNLHASKRKPYDSQKHLQIVTKNCIEQQIPPDFKLYSGPLELEISFYLQLPPQVRDMREVYLEPHFMAPALSHLIKHIEECGKKLIFQDSFLISSVIAHKMYHNNPRTEFKINRLRKK